MTDATFTSLNTQKGAGFGARIKSWLGATFATIVTARENEARRQVGYYLSNLDDKTLSELGYDRKEITRWV